MSVSPWRQEFFRPWVEWVALQIGDPVARLRFLRFVAPGVSGSAPAPRRMRIVMFLLALAVLAFLILAVAMRTLSLVVGQLG